MRNMIRNNFIFRNSQILDTTKALVFLKAVEQSPNLLLLWIYHTADADSIPGYFPTETPEWINNWAGNKLVLRSEQNGNLLYKTSPDTY